MDLFSGTSIKRWAKGLAKFVRSSDEVSLYQGSFSYISQLLGKENRPLYRGLRYIM